MIKSSFSDKVTRRTVMNEVPALFKLFVGTMACFLILFGIHWIAILVGLVLGIVYYMLPKVY
jgi:hypothetical protein